MIKSFKHKGLERFYETGSKRGVNPEHAAKLGRILDRLDASTAPSDMNLPGNRLHLLSGDREGTWAVIVSGNCRITFGFDGEDAIDVDYLDYH